MCAMVGHVAKFMVDAIHSLRKEMQERITNSMKVNCITMITMIAADLAAYSPMSHI